MGISSSNHFFVVLIALLSLTSAYASRALVDYNASKKNDDSLKKTMMMVPTNGAMTQRTNMINSGVDNEAQVVEPKIIGEQRTQSPSETTNEEMTCRMDTVNSEVHKKTHVQMVSTNGAMTHEVDMGNNGLHNEARVVRNGEPVKPSMETNGKDGTHGLRETANEVFPLPNENEEH